MRESWKLKKIREVETVIHLAGEPVGKRWTHEIKKKIIFSRSDAGRFLFESLAAQDKPPKTLISASGIGFYGVANETKFDEESAKGRGFLADVVEDWESAPEPLHKVGNPCGEHANGCSLESGWRSFGQNASSF
ncbi:MAG: hypothetical protein ACJ0DH_07340 [bacterium]